MACAVAGVATLVPSFSLLTGLTGAFGNNILGLVLPPAFYWRLMVQKGGASPAGQKGVLRRPEAAALLLTTAFGLWFLVFSTSASLRVLLLSAAG